MIASDRYDFLRDPKTATKKELASMSDNESVLGDHAANKLDLNPSDKTAEFGLDLSGE